MWFIQMNAAISESDECCYKWISSRLKFLNSMYTNTAFNSLQKQTLWIRFIEPKFVLYVHQHQNNEGYHC